MRTHSHIAALFEQRKHQPLLNTSSPLHPSHWAPYRVSQGTLPFDADDTLSMYVHVPFCQRLCAFANTPECWCPMKKRRYII